MADSRTDRPLERDDPTRIPLRRLLGKPDRNSVIRFCVVLLGFPVIALLARELLLNAGIESDDARIVGNVVAAFLISGWVYLVSRRRLLMMQDRERITRELTKVTARYRMIAENSTDIVYIAGTDRLTTWISPSVTKVLGWEPREMLGRSIASFMHQDDQDATEEVRALIYSGQYYETPVGGFVMRFLTKSGEYRWMSINTRQVSDANGRHVNVVGGLTLVDDLVHARQRAESDHALLQVTADAMLDPQVLLRALRNASSEVEDFEFEQVNRATCDYLRAEREELVGKRLLEAIPGLLGTDMFAMYARTMDSDAPLSVDDFPFSLPDGGTSYFDLRARRVEGDRLALTWRNVTAERQTAIRLAESEIRFRLLAENSSDVIVLSDERMALNWVSPSSLMTLGWLPEELIGRRASEYIHPDDLADLQRQVAESTASGEQIRPRYRWRRPDGSYLWVEAAGRPVMDDGSGRPGRVVEIRDIDAEVRAQEQLKRRATFDDLTGALMRDGAFRRLAEIEARSPEFESATGVLFIDIDDFKQVNDRFGHATGDLVLRTLADRTRAAVRGADVVARMGGDEFLVILESVGSMERALQVASKIHSGCALPVNTPSGDVLVTISVGATLIGPGETADDTIARADAAMYSAKGSGRNQVVAIPLA